MCRIMLYIIVLVLFQSCSSTNPTPSTSPHGVQNPIEPENTGKHEPDDQSEKDRDGDDAYPSGGRWRGTAPLSDDGTPAENKNYEPRTPRIVAPQKILLWCYVWKGEIFAHRSVKIDYPGGIEKIGHMRGDDGIIYVTFRSTFTPQVEWIVLHDNLSDGEHFLEAVLKNNFR